MLNKKKLPGETIEFLPDALEIEHSKLPLSVRLTVWAPVVILFAGLIWSIFSKVDVIVTANGKIVTDTPTIVMKPLERSMIQKINVKIGEVVKKDQVLITFDPALNRAESARIANELATLTAQFNRLKAEFLGVEYTDNGNQFEKWQKAIHKHRMDYYRERIKYFDESLEQIAASKKTKEDTLKKQEERLAAVKRLELMFKSLHEKNAASLKELLQMSITRMEMEAAVDQLRNEIDELKHQKGSTLASKNSFIQEWRNSISSEMVTTDRNMISAAKEYDKVKQLADYLYLKAPCDAVVHEVASFSPGSAVREAEALITLIPLGGKVEVEAEVRPQDIGKVELGASTRIKLNAFPFQKHGTLDGTVRNISEDTLQRQQGAAPQDPEISSASYYRARITAAGKLRGVKDNFRLIPGMEVTAEIKTGRRRVIEYLIYPLIKAFDEAAREP